MGKVITCECGYVIRGARDEELLAGAREHMGVNHPAIAAQITDEQLLAMAEERPDGG